MKVFIVYWHPEPKSINGALFKTAQETLRAAGHEVVVSDLHEMNFNPVTGRHNFHSVKDPDYLKVQLEEQYATEHNGFTEEIETELKKLESCDLFIMQFPLWWFGMPAMMRGWVDRVFAMGRAYGNGKLYNEGVFKGKRAFLSLTTGGPAASYQKDGFNGDINGILRPIHRGILQFVGFSVLAPHIVYGPVRLTDEERQAQLAAYAERLKTIVDEKLFEVGRY